MFHTMRPEMAHRMGELEVIDARDRNDGTPQARRLRQVPATTGRFLALQAAAAPEGAMLEIGTSAGYSTLWLALACEAAGRRIRTYEMSPEKVKLAQETFRKAGVDSLVEVVTADVRQHFDEINDVAFCFLDAEKEFYGECYEGIVPRLVSGGLLLVDNVTSHEEELRPFVARALADERVDAVVVPIDRGVLLCRKA